MYKLEDFRKLVQDYGKVADFVVVYMEEAHASDEWNLKNNPFSIRVHRNLEERLDAARILHQMALPCPLLVDGMDNNMIRRHPCLGQCQKGLWLFTMLESSTKARKVHFGMT